MKRVLLLSFLLMTGILLQGQTGGGKIPCKVYLKNGEVKEGKSSININDSRIGIMGVGIGIKGKKFMKEITLKPKSGKKEKISIDQIDKIEYELPAKIFSKEVKTITYKPLEVDGETILAREIVANKLYSVHKVKGLTIGSTDVDGGQHDVYYLKKSGEYKQTTLASIKKEYKCSMEEGKGREDKIAQCLKGK